MPYFDPTTPSTSVATDNTNTLNRTLDGADLLNDTLADAQQMPQSCVDNTLHTDEDSFELGTPSTSVTTNNTTINITIDEVVDTFADAPLTPCVTSSNNTVPLGLFSYATPAATPVKDRVMHSPPFVATSGVEQLAHILAYNTNSKKEWEFAPKSIPDKLKNVFAASDKVNFNLGNDYTRYSLDNFGQLIPADFNQQTFVAIFAVVKEPEAQPNMKIWFARANGSQYTKLSHAQLASGAEKVCSCLAAGEIHFKKEQGTWIVSEINNQTGHFLGDLYSLFVPLQLLLPRTELWGENVSIKQVVNSASTVVQEGPKAFRKTPYEHNVNYLRGKFAQVAIEQATLLVQDSSLSQLAFLLDNAQNLLRIVNEKMAQESTQSRNQHFELDLFQNKASHAIQIPVKTDFQSLIKSPVRPMVASRIADRASLNRGGLNHATNFNLCDSDENDQQPRPLSYSAFKSNFNSSDSRQSNRSFRLANEACVNRDLANNPHSKVRDRNYESGESYALQLPSTNNVLQNRSGLLPLPLPQLQSIDRDSDYNIRDGKHSRVPLPNNVLQNRSSLFPHPLPRLQPMERDSDYVSDRNYSRAPLTNTAPQNRSGLFHLPPTQLQQHDETIQDEHSTPTHI